MGNKREGDLQGLQHLQGPLALLACSLRLAAPAVKQAQEELAQKATAGLTVYQIKFET